MSSDSLAVQKTSSDGLVSLLKRLFQHVEKRRKRQFMLLVCLTLVCSVAEIISLGAVVPFIGVLTQPEKVFEYPALSGFIEFLDIKTPGDLVLPLTVGFAVAALVAGGLRLLLLWVSIRLANATGADLSIAVYRKTLYQPYNVHVERSSSEIISGITQKVSAASGLLISLVTVVTSLVLFVAILITLLAIDPVVATSAMFGLGVVYIVIAWKTRKRLSSNSQHIAREQTNVVKALQEGLGAIRDVLLDGVQAVYSSVYRKAILKLQKANGENAFINQAPRYALESLALVLVAGLAFLLSFGEGGVGAALPVLGALALGAQRILPLLQQLYGNWAVVVGSKAILIDVLGLLDQPIPEYIGRLDIKPLDFQHDIKFDGVSFRYKEDGPLILNDINLILKKGSRTGIVGGTGSGKSTMLDLLMSLLTANSGKILVDGKVVEDSLVPAWQRSVVHVPQSIFLADASIAENIAFGVPKDQIDLDRVKSAAKQAQIADFVEESAEGYDAIVGERGVRLSGGQRQRIGIARALYKQAKTLVFDEATSALDSDTEDAVMRSIEELDRDLTILIIAHRVSTLKNCDRILKLERGRVVADCTYNEYVGESIRA